jgi:phosphatidylglycerol:prolipoprotein diacylglycerol transferase
MLVLASRSRERWSLLIQENIFNWILGAVVLGWLLPIIEARVGRGTASEMIVGLPVRGYGVFLMLGVVGAIWLGRRRTQQLSIPAEHFMALALYTVIGGLLGARIFYVVQKWDELEGGSFAGKLWTALQFTEGGLVVYGSILGGIAGILAWTVRYRVKPISLLDAIVPAFFIGLAFGRIGCLLNGCCYGGICELELPSIAFPRGAPAYMDQLHSGRLLGIHARSDTSGVGKVEEVDASSWAAQHDVHSGQQLDAIDAIQIADTREALIKARVDVEGRVVIDRKTYRFHSEDLPARSLPVHPSQVYASLSALLLCVWTASIPNWIRRPGIVFGTGWIAYGILRTLEEIVRVDEAGQFGTSLTIAQWISLLGIVAGAFFVVRALWKPLTPIESSPTPTRG